MLEYKLKLVASIVLGMNSIEQSPSTEASSFSASQEITCV
jgi:hypothetical protein